MVKRLFVLAVVFIMCIMPFAAPADSITLQNNSITILCEGLQPGERYSFIASRSINKEDILEDNMLLYIDQQTADDAGTISITFIHADLPNCGFWTGGVFTEGETSPKMIGTYTAEADGELLPAALETIEAEAFAGSAFRQVVIGSKVTTIGAKAFQNCAELHRIVIPGSVTTIADDAFDGCNNLTMVCEKGSAAWEYATEKQFTIEIR